MGVTAPHIPATAPELTVVGEDDSMFTRASSYFADKLPVNPRSQYLEVRANHLNTPSVAGAAVVRWVKATVSPAV